MSRLAIVILMAALPLLVSCGSKFHAPPTAGLVKPNSEIPIRYSAFYGVWTGKWDEYWDVVFVIDEIDDGGSVGGDYYWKEYVPGPWNYRRLAGQIQGDSLQLDLIRIDLDSATSDTATAFGDFPMDRTARIKKLEGPESAMVVWQN